MTMIIAATGHRPVKFGGYSEEVYNDLVTLAKSYLSEVRPERVITGMALGWDQAWALAAIEEAIPVVAAIPFVGQEAMWQTFQKARYFELLKYCDDVEYICDPGYKPWKMQVRNEWMVDKSDHVCALWNGSDGGTANCVRYAESKAKTITNLWPHWERFRNSKAVA